jgi:hypothetical protein
MRLPFKAVYNFRPSVMKPTPGQERIKGGKIGYSLVCILYPLLNLVLPGMPLVDLARAMINAVRYGAPKNVLEVPDLRALAAR